MMFVNDGVKCRDFVSQELVLQCEDRQVVEFPLVMVIVREGDWCTRFDLSIGNESEEMITEEFAVHDRCETGFERDLGRTVTSGSGSDVGSITDFFSGVLTKAVDSFARHRIKDDLTSKLK